MYTGEMKAAEGIMEAGAFNGCVKLNRIVLPPSISELKEGVFIECAALKEIVVPKSVKKIGNYGLRTNFSVEVIIFEGEEAPELVSNPFPFVSDISKILVPSGKSETYKAKWGSYESYHSKIEEKS